MAENLDAMVSDESARREMAHQAWAFGRTSSWPAVARRYWDVFNKVVPAPALAPATAARRATPVVTGSTFGTAPRVSPKVGNVSSVHAKTRTL